MNTTPQPAQEAEPTRQQEHLAPDLVLGMLAQLVSFAQQMQPATRLSRLRGWLATLLHPRRAKPPAPDAAARAEILALLGQLNAIATAFPPQPTPQPISELSPSETPTAAQPCSHPPPRAARPRPEPGQHPPQPRRPRAPYRPRHDDPPALHIHRAKQIARARLRNPPPAAPPHRQSSSKTAFRLHTYPRP